MTTEYYRTILISMINFYFFRYILRYKDLYDNPKSCSEHHRFLLFTSLVIGIPHSAHFYTSISNTFDLPNLAERRRRQITMYYIYKHIYM